MNENPSTPPSNDELRARLERAVRENPLGETFADPVLRRRKLFELMAATDSPMAKELGQALLSGQMSLRDVISSSAYQDYLDQGLEKIREVSLVEIADQLEAEGRAQEDQLVQPADDDEDYSDGPIVFRRPDDRR